MSVLLYAALVLATGFERLAELVVSARHARWSFARGGVESGRGHFGPMVLLHTGLLVACVVEVVALDRPFLPWLGWPMLVLVLASQGLRWWCIGTLGPQWNTRVIVVPGLSLVRRGPYRWIPHPNYVAVVLEGIALPLVHSAWITAVGFTVLNAWLLLGFRIPAEERALEAAVEPAQDPGRR
ncbi:alkylresorcinol O-methyltransferase [Isoptericola sp. CG 20/1183]|uniref:Alkylresorcinol O-methyltransferase n=1 Tax=Isoptericola halotolerans TaxID=300560 RepID=A0ABX5EJ43_9MICO|nr:MULTISPECIES: isoprenylcysteine carboxyl methyltransferase family protein [Isoptericola]PRZ09709.1 alkylresorcinol O-methyltransferase [Isoptericola sp. CG 20/1183]PRZ10510.1 alkylresorcinol O-methyltransferase [Isoptericola halotolerans]